MKKNLIKHLTDLSDLPQDLLLEADPEPAKIEAYLKDSEALVYGDSEIVGSLVFQRRLQEVEIVNLAVAVAWRQQKIATQLLQKLFQIVPAGTELIIKTGATSPGPIDLYQQLGFQKVAVIKDYFINNYCETIVENGQILRDQVILKKLI